MNAALGERRLPPVPAGADAAWVTSDRIGHELIRLIRLIERGKVAKAREDGVERAAYVLLARLVIEGPHRSNALAEAVHSDPSTVSRQIATLVRIGYVERRPDPADGRASLLILTARARAFEPVAARTMAELDAATRGRLGDAGTDSLKRALRTLMALDG